LPNPIISCTLLTRGHGTNKSFKVRNMTEISADYFHVSTDIIVESAHGAINGLCFSSDGRRLYVGKYIRLGWEL